jgi:hypothetical protein
MNNEVKSNDSGKKYLAFIFFTQALFVILKVVQALDWSWWLILIPTWIALGWLTLLILLFIIIMLVYYIRRK